MSSKEISVKDTFLKLISYVKLLWSKALWIILIALIFGSLFAYKALKSDKKYTAKLTFMINEENGGGNGMLSSVLGQIGLPGSGGKNNYNRIIEIANSDKILRKVLLTTTLVDSSIDCLANHIIRTYNLHKKWEEDSSLASQYIDTTLYNEGYTTSQKNNLVLAEVMNLLRGNANEGINGLLNISYMEESGILSLTCNTLSQELSASLVEIHYDILSVFYINQSIGDKKITYRQLEQKADSVKRLLHGSESAYASGQDKSLGYVLNRDKIGTARAFSNIKLYQEMYVEVLRNKETAEFILKSNTPFFQKIDRPNLPLEPEKESILLASIIGMSIGSFLSILVVLGISFVRSVFSQDIQN